MLQMCQLNTSSPLGYFMLSSTFTHQILGRHAGKQWDHVHEPYNELGISIIFYPEQYTLTAWVLNMNSNTPVVGARILCYLTFYGNTTIQELGAVLTNNEGLVNISLPKSINEYYTAYVTVQNDGILLAPQQINIPPYIESQSICCWYYSDREIYQPGDTIYMKGYVRLINLNNTEPKTVEDNFTLSVQWSTDENEQPIRSGSFHKRFRRWIRWWCNDKSRNRLRSSGSLRVSSPPPRVLIFLQKTLHYGTSPWNNITSCHISICGQKNRNITDEFYRLLCKLGCCHFFLGNSWPIGTSFHSH